jgi:hypothetical protein
VSGVTHDDRDALADHDVTAVVGCALAAVAVACAVPLVGAVLLLVALVRRVARRRAPTTETSR